MKTKLPTVLTAKSRDLSVRTLPRGILTVRSQCRGLHAHQRFSSVALLELFLFLLFALCYLLLGRTVMTNLKVKKVKSLSRARFFATPWTVAHQAPPSMGYSRQEYWSGLPFPSPGDLPDPGIEYRSPALQADVLTSEPPGKPHDQPRQHIKKQRHYFANIGSSSQGYGFSSGHVWV